MNKLFEKNSKLMPLSAVVLAILSILIEFLLNILAPDGLGYYSIPKIILMTMMKLVLSVIFIVIASKLYEIKIGFGKKKLVKGIFWYGLLLCIVSIIDLVGTYTKPEIGFIEALPVLGLIFIFSMSIGLYEEIVYRGFIFGSFRKHFGESKKGIYLSVLLSSFVFGCAYLTNYILAPELVISAITQVFYAFFIGVFLAVIYYRTENLLPCIILHGIYNFAVYFWFCFAKDIIKMLNMSTTDMDIVSALVVIVSNSLFLIAGLLQLRKEFNNKSVNSIVK